MIRDGGLRADIFEVLSLRVRAVKTIISMGTHRVQAEHLVHSGHPQTSIERHLLPWKWCSYPVRLRAWTRSWMQVWILESVSSVRLCHRDGQSERRFSTRPDSDPSSWLQRWLALGCTCHLAGEERMSWMYCCCVCLCSCSSFAVSGFWRLLHGLVLIVPPLKFGSLDVLLLACLTGLASCWEFLTSLVKRFAIRDTCAVISWLHCCCVISLLFFFPHFCRVLSRCLPLLVCPHY